jgi:predicted DNA-binding protein
MKDTRVQINFRLEKDLLERIKIKTKGVNLSEFIRDAVENKLENLDDTARQFRRLSDKISQFDFGSLHKSLGDQMLTSEAIFEELRRQNELLKLIHRRSIFGANFARELFENIKPNLESRDDLIRRMEELINKELTQLKFY